MIPPSLPTSGVDPRISRRRDLENDVSGSSKPVDEIRMIDGVSGLRVDSRLDCIIRLRIRLRLQSLMERRGFEEDSFEFWFFEKDVPLSVTKIYVDEFMERIIRKKKRKMKKCIRKRCSICEFSSYQFNPNRVKPFHPRFFLDSMKLITSCRAYICILIFRPDSTCLIYINIYILMYLRIFSFSPCIKYSPTSIEFRLRKSDLP